MNQYGFEISTTALATPVVLGIVAATVTALVHDLRRRHQPEFKLRIFGSLLIAALLTTVAYLAL
jgi:hypothetical protein